jgi:hypothetical protein
MILGSVIGKAHENLPSSQGLPERVRVVSMGGDFLLLQWKGHSLQRGGLATHVDVLQLKGD